MTKIEDQNHRICFVFRELNERIDALDKRIDAMGVHLSSTFDIVEELQKDILVIRASAPTRRTMFTRQMREVKRRVH